MKQKLIDFIKYNKIIFFLYNRLGSLLIRFVGLFIPINEKKILFVSFGGRKYDDSPQSIYEKMITMPQFRDYEFVWAFTDTNKKIPGNARMVKIDSLSYFHEALSARFWIINVSAERGLNFKKKGTTCVNTWHGVPLKRIYGEENEKQKEKGKRKPEKFDLICSQSTYDQEIFARIFQLDKNDVIISDLPRNDCLLKYSDTALDSIRRSLGIPKDKKIILYMPTYREYERDSSNACLFLPPVDFKFWKEKLGDQYVLLFRAHYLVVKSMEIENDEFIKDVSNYPQLSDLYAVSDILISDYSSAFIDYAILERPEFCFAYDYEQYKEKRGFYVELNEILPCDILRDEHELINAIVNMDYEIGCAKTKKFKQQFAPVAGNATERVINEVLKRYIK